MPAPAAGRLLLLAQAKGCSYGLWQLNSTTKKEHVLALTVAGNGIQANVCIVRIVMENKIYK